jgi:hypothetical protein
VLIDISCSRVYIMILTFGAVLRAKSAGRLLRVFGFLRIGFTDIIEDSSSLGDQSRLRTRVCAAVGVVVRLNTY